MPINLYSTIGSSNTTRRDRATKILASRYNNDSRSARVRLVVDVDNTC